MAYEFLEHTADVKFRASGSTVEECFNSAVGALNETIRGDIDISESEEKSFEVEGKDLEGLLYSFLEEFLFLLDAEDFLVARIKSIKISGLSLKFKGARPSSSPGVVQPTHKSEVVTGEAGGSEGLKLKCVVAGDSSENYKFTNDVKAVTYNEMFVRQEKDKWICQVVLDV